MVIAAVPGLRAEPPGYCPGCMDPSFGNLGSGYGLTGYGFGQPETDSAWDLAVMLGGDPPDWDD